MLEGSPLGLPIGMLEGFPLGFPLRMLEGSPLMKPFGLLKDLYSGALLVLPNLLALPPSLVLLPFAAAFTGAVAAPLPL